MSWFPFTASKSSDESVAGEPVPVVRLRPGASVGVFSADDGTAKPVGLSRRHVDERVRMTAQRAERRQRVDRDPVREALRGLAARRGDRVLRRGADQRDVVRRQIGGTDRQLGRRLDGRLSFLNRTEPSSEVSSATRRVTVLRAEVGARRGAVRRPGRDERVAAAVRADAARARARGGRVGVAAEHPEAFLLVEDAGERLVEDRQRHDAVQHGLVERAAARAGRARGSRAAGSGRALEVVRDPADMTAVARAVGIPVAGGEPTRVAGVVGARAAGRVVRAVAAGHEAVGRRHLLLHPLEDPRGGVLRRVVGADHRRRAPHAAQHVGQAERLLAGEVRLVQRPRLRVLARVRERGRPTSSEEIGSARAGLVEVSRQIWYEHIVAAARPSTNPCSYGVK